MSLLNLTVADLHEKLQRREVTSVDVTREVIDRIKKEDIKINAFITETPEVALLQAEKADDLIQRGGELPSLVGVPMSVKDVILTEGVRTTAGSKILDTYFAPYDATVIERLKQRGMVMVGKTNCDEFAMGASNENSAYGVVRNPWDMERVPGGSSGGAAASVASGQCFYALASDTGGSVRQPAAFCGLVGIKPSYGRVSRYGLIALCSSFDQIGAITKTVRDSAVVMNVLAGPDAKDGTTYPKPAPDYTKTFELDVTNLKIGVPKQYFVEGMDKEVETIVRQAIQKLADLGADIQEVDLPMTPYAVAVYYTILPAEVSANLARYDGVRFGARAGKGTESLLEMYLKTRAQGFGPEVKRRIMIGAHALSSGYYQAYYVRAQKVRAAMKREFDHVFEQVDCLVSPTTPTTAFKIGEKFSNPLTMYLEDIFTAPANIAGLCAISVPCGLAHGLPVGLQFIGNRFDEEIIYRAAYHYERVSGWMGLEV